MLKRAYVGMLRGIRGAVRAVGLLEPWDRWARRSRIGHWSRSLLAVYDLDDLAALDSPWWTYDARDRVEAYLRSHPGARVLEWGSGSSTLWLARRAAEVTAIEHDAGWAGNLASRLPDNATLHAVVPRAASGQPGEVHSQKSGNREFDFRDYVSAIDGMPGAFDVIVVDGRAREACLPKALDRLAPGGIIVVDNVDRRRYRDAIAALGDRVRTDWTRGLTPTLPYPTRTAILHRATEPRG